jgi:hypothetical protein
VKQFETNNDASWIEEDEDMDGDEDEDEDSSLTS